MGKTKLFSFLGATETPGKQSQPPRLLFGQACTRDLLLLFPLPAVIVVVDLVAVVGVVCLVLRRLHDKDTFAASADSAAAIAGASS